MTRVALAAVAGVHGLNGEVKLKLFAQSVDSLARHRTVLVGGEPLAMSNVRDGGKTAIARFKGVNDRAAAEALRGQLVEIERDELPPLEDGEYYHADLIGLAAIDAAGAPVGRVVAVHNFGAGDIIEIAPPQGNTLLLPFTNAVVPTVDLKAGHVVIEMPAEIIGEDPTTSDD